MNRRTGLYLLMGALFLGVCADARTEPLKVFFIGNSLTMNANPRVVQSLLAEQGIPMDFASQLSGGKSLIRHANYANETEQKWMTNASFDGNFSRNSEYGTYDQALRDHPWDAVVLQLFSSNLHDDLKAISTFIDLCQENRTCNEFYLYSTWPSRPRVPDQDYALADFDYSTEWNLEYTALPDDTSRRANAAYASRDYVDQLVTTLQDRYPGKNLTIRVIPVGEVLFQLDQKIRGGRMPGLLHLARRNPSRVPGFRTESSDEDGVGLFYNDPIHLKKGVGVLTSATTIATVLGGKSPVGLSGAPFELGSEEDKEVVRQIQETIWETVIRDPRTGVQKP